MHQQLYLLGMRQTIPGLQIAPSFRLGLQRSVRGSLCTLCHHDNASSMSEWVYTLHLVILSDQHGNSCVRAERVQASNHAKIHLITENVATLVGIMELVVEWLRLASTVYSTCIFIGE